MSIEIVHQVVQGYDKAADKRKELAQQNKKTDTEITQQQTDKAATVNPLEGGLFTVV